MAVHIRLARYGGKKNPYYRIVASDSEGRRDGRFIEQIGSYDPKKNPPAITLDVPRYQHWLSVGARPSDTVRTVVAPHLGA